MRILSLNSNDTRGGAARAASRINHGLGRIGIDCKTLVQRKRGSSPNVIGPRFMITNFLARLRPFIDKLPNYFYPRRDKRYFSNSIVPGLIKQRVQHHKPDLVHLHWVCAGFIRIEAIKKISFPMVWTLHDSWAFTGGCHLPFDCLKYRDNCGNCPALNSRSGSDLSRWNLRRKHKHWQDLNLTVVTPSNWLAECVKQSSLFKSRDVKVIPNGIDVDFFKPEDRITARKLLGLEKDKKFILFGAINATGDKNKGFQYLQPALKKYLRKELKQKIELLIFGSAEPVNPPDFGIKAHYLGRINDDKKLVQVYSAADAVILSSIQENLPNIVMEAMACGTPCVTFRIGGIPDMIDQKINGYMAEPFKVQDLARGISWVIEDNQKLQSLSQNARKKIVENFSLNQIATKYYQLYKDILHR